MTIPANAAVFPDAMDPSDEVDYVIGFDYLLNSGEKIDTVSLTVLPEAVALGLTILTDADHGPWIADDLYVELWPVIDPAFKDNAAFLSGASLPIEMTVVTDATPPRTFQRTAVLRVVQQ